MIRTPRSITPLGDNPNRCGYTSQDIETYITQHKPINADDIPVNSYTDFQPLEELILGRCYSSDFFRNKIKNEKTCSMMMKIADEMEEDYNKIVETLENENIIVRRPRVMYEENFWEYPDYNNATIKDMPKPPISPRDYYITIGNTIYDLAPIPTAQHFDVINYYDLFMEYYQKGANWVSHPFAPNYKNFEPDKFVNSVFKIEAPTLVRAGKDLFVDPHALNKPTLEWLARTFGDKHRIHVCDTFGRHADGVYSILRPGLILANKAKTDFSEVFPGWDVIVTPDPTHKQAEWDALVRSGGSWTVDGIYESPEFEEYVNTCLTQWTGFAAESVFITNCLSLSEDKVLFCEYDKEIFGDLEKRGITPIYVPFRHQYFWDGGIHCNTMDVRRKGGMEDYFS